MFSLAESARDIWLRMFTRISKNQSSNSIQHIKFFFQIDWHGGHCASKEAKEKNIVRCVLSLCNSYNLLKLAFKTSRQIEVDFQSYNKVYCRTQNKLWLQNIENTNKIEWACWVALAALMILWNSGYQWPYSIVNSVICDCLDNSAMDDNGYNQPLYDWFWGLIHRKEDIHGTEWLLSVPCV